MVVCFYKEVYQDMLFCPKMIELCDRMVTNLYKDLCLRYVMVDSTTTSTDLKYAQWNPFFTSLQQDVDELKRLNKLLRRNTALIEDFFSLINTMYNSHIVYSSDLQDKLNIIEEKIFGRKYQRALMEKNVTSNMRTFQFKVIKELEQCFQLLVTNFESNGLFPKRIITKHRPKGQALIN